MNTTTIGAVIALVLSIIGLVNLDNIDLVDPVSDALLGLAAFSGGALIDTWRAR